MKTPPLLLGAAVLFWGWQTGMPALAVVLGALLELSRVVKIRWAFSQEDLNRIWTLCGALFFGAAVYAFTSNEGPSAVSGFFQATSYTERSQALNKAARSVVLFLQWWPLAFFPFALVQAFSVQDRVDLSTFSLWLRSRKAKVAVSAPLRRPRRGAPYLSPEPAAPLPGHGLNVSYPFFGLVLFSASAGNKEGWSFYGGLSALVVWALWRERCPRFGLPVWLVSVSAAVGLGWLGRSGIERLQVMFQEFNNAWVSHYARQGTNPRESYTAIGQIGRMKLSGRIVLRVEDRAGLVPPLVREVSYNRFRSPSWYGESRLFQPVFPETNETTWVFQRQSLAPNVIRVAQFLSGGRGILPMPSGLTRIENLLVFQMETNRLGTLRVAEGPGLAVYDLHFGPGPTIDAAPDRDEDLAIPSAEEPALSRIADELKLDGRPPPEVVKTVAAFFTRHFQYSAYSESRRSSNQTALASFLLKERSGHCEYFATATTLLLRKAGIPARYAVGYSIQERSGQTYLVRQRHAHAWTLAYLDGIWRDVDNTPGTWIAAEADKASWLEPVKDLFSRLWFEFSKWRWGQSQLRRYLPWILAPVLAVMIGRLFFNKQWKRLKQQTQEKWAAQAFPGLDSEFYKIEARLAEQGWTRPAHETLSDWLARIERDGLGEKQATRLRPLLQLHNRYRFDPKSLSADERTALCTGAVRWLEGEL